ncbi:MAG TPA: M13 family metallopeptidase [Rhizomicrobium sp.]|nr:M13 family metallopeptidase [Rhizomicrobium sp.]
MRKILYAAALAGAATLAFAAAPVFGPWGLSLDYIDPGVRPGDDFFRYANGGWLKTATIPSDRTVAGVNLELDKGNEAKLKTIVAELEAKPESQLTAEERKLRDLYDAFEDVNAIDAAGLKPVKADLAKIAKLQTLAQVAAVMASPTTEVDEGPIGMHITINQKKPSTYTLRLYQSGLGLPDRDYYLGTDKQLAATRDAYKAYIVQMLTFAGVKDAAARGAAVYAVEEKIAEAHWPAADKRNTDKTYNPMTVSALAKLAPQFPWDAYFAAAGVSRNSPSGERVVIVVENTAFPKLAAIFAETPVAVWRDYLTVHYLHRFADYLPTKIDDADFAFYGTVLKGQKEQLPRDLRGVHLLDAAMGEALGKLYVAKYFSPEAKAKVTLLVHNLLKAYEADIQTLTWMAPETRAKALEKIRHFTPKVGYPDTWRDYTALTIVPHDIVADIKNAETFAWNRQLKRIDQPVDRSEWGMTPPTNNAYYNPTLNEIVFPAGILQPPYFDPNADDAVNYGEAGATIGHEISHGFDDQGSKYDAYGVLQNWWTPDDRKNFDARTDMLAKQYDGYEPLPGLHINGRLTLGENIADLAGLVIAHKAYQLALGGKPAPVLDGFTGDQRFYLAYGQSWREIWTDGRTRQVVLSNPHSPAKFRVNGVVRNDDGWYQAFDVKPGDALYLPPESRVKLW